jgi:hypothetical protein
VTTAETFRERVDRLNGFVDDDVNAPEPELVPPPSPDSDAMPELHPAALYGLAGNVVHAIDRTTEADRVAVHVTFLTYFGIACGRSPHLMVGDSRHGTNTNNVLVGQTSRSRKGTSKDGPHRLITIADPDFVGRIQGGLSSGEGLIWAVRDEIQRFNSKSGEYEIAEPGVTDKRLLCIEEEMSQVLKTGQRQGATITEIIRRAWDAPTVLQTMTKTSPAKATDAHIGILGHITKAELAREITETDLANGLANRFTWFRVRRSKLLPNPVRMPDDVAYELGERIRLALTFARETGLVTRDVDATEMWNVAYPELERDRPGLAGAITARASPITLRFALIYALLDRSRVIRPEHLEAALAVWDYAEASVLSIFGDLTGDAVADRIVSMLTTEGQMTRNDLTDAFGRNVSSARIGHALDLLHRSDRIHVWKIPPSGGKGRPRTIYEAVRDKRDKRD